MLGSKNLFVGINSYLFIMLSFIIYFRKTVSERNFIRSLYKFMSKIIDLWYVCFIL